MLNLNYRHFLICMICFMPTFCLAQATYDGQVIDKATEDPIAGVNVTIIKEKTGTQTNERGYFELSFEKPLATDDTLQFSFVGYKTFKLPVSQYQPQIIITLEANSVQLNEVNIARKKKLKDIVLDKFNSYDLKNTDMHSNEVIKLHTAIAKLFTAPKPNALLTKISLGRQDLHESPTFAIRNKFTTFLIHIITPDTLTGAPGKLLFTKTISLIDNSLWVDVDLSKDKIIIPSKSFFIAIEWTISPYNEIIAVKNAPKAARMTKRSFQILKDAAEYHSYYQPFLVGYDSENDPRKQVLLYVWLNNQWQLFKEHQKSELALSATIRY